MTKDQELLQSIAKLFIDVDWLDLTQLERSVARSLIKSGYLEWEDLRTHGGDDPRHESGLV